VILDQTTSRTQRQARNLRTRDPRWESKWEREWNAVPICGRGRKPG